MTTTKKALVIYGTRPEAIKMAPVVKALERSPVLEPVVAVTGQHREMLDQVNALFGIVPQHDLDIIRPRQELHEITSRALAGLTHAIRIEQPGIAGPTEPILNRSVRLTVAGAVVSVSP